MSDRQDTIAAIATPPGTGGIGIVRLSGPHSVSIARAITGTEPQQRHAHYCRFHDREGRVIDTGILLYFRAPHSFTGEDVVELHGHGGRMVLGLLLNETLVRGARLARPGEFTERAWLNERIDLVQAEAIADLINSASERAARSAARSLEGEFSRVIHRIVGQLIGLRVYVEGALDFPEEEIDFIAGSDVLDRLQAASPAC
jgi:tRNA modification GTPase